jgi:hypothetical protein
MAWRQVLTSFSYAEEMKKKNENLDSSSSSKAALYSFWKSEKYEWDCHGSNAKETRNSGSKTNRKAPSSIIKIIYRNQYNMVNSGSRAMDS